MSYQTLERKIKQLIDKVQNEVDTSDANAVADDIVIDKTAYVNGSKVIGTNPYHRISTDTEVDIQRNFMLQVQTALLSKVVKDVTVLLFTQDEYDALATKDADTLYLIKGVS